MAWNQNSAFDQFVEKFLSLKLRHERLKIMEQAKLISTMLSTQGVDTSKIEAILSAAPAVAAPKKELNLVTYKRKGVWRKRYLSVVVKPGSVF